MRLVLLLAFALAGCVEPGTIDGLTIVVTNDGQTPITATLEVDGPEGIILTETGQVGELRRTANLDRGAYFVTVDYEAPGTFSAQSHVVDAAACEGPATLRFFVSYTNSPSGQQFSDRGTSFACTG